MKDTRYRGQRRSILGMSPLEIKILPSIYWAGVKYWTNCWWASRLAPPSKGRHKRRKLAIKKQVTVLDLQRRLASEVGPVQDRLRMGQVILFPPSPLELATRSGQAHARRPDWACDTTQELVRVGC
jgi:hypothetical protein